MSWTKIGLRRGGSHIATSRSTLTNVIASPMPMSSRAAIAVHTSGARAKPSCPAAISAAPVISMRREPNRSSSMPTGICMPAYMTSCATENRPSTAAPMPNRCAAVTPATASEVRWKTATM